MAIHDFDMAQFVTGSEVTEVFAVGAVRFDPLIGELGDFDTAVVVLTHADGTITTIDNSRQTAYGYDQRVEVFGSAGVVRSENTPTQSTLVRYSSGERSAPIPHFFLDRYLDSYMVEWEAFATAVTDDAEPPVTGQDGRAPLVIALAAERSASERRPVRIDEIC